MNLLAVYDMCGSYAETARLVSCSPNTVKNHVVACAAGRRVGERRVYSRAIEPFLNVIEMHVEQGRGACRADALHEVLVTMGFTGSLRSTQRAVKAVKAEYHLGQGRKHRPWVPEPGLWVQFDYGDGPVIEGKKTTLFVAWFPWSRFRVVIPLRDKTYGSVFAALAETFNRAGGVPTFVLTDNEKTVTTKHIAGAPVRSPMMVDFSRHYGTTVHTCTVADPQSKGGSESSVKLAKADLLPRPGNFRAEYTSFEDLTRACHTWCEEVNHRVHTVTRATPVSLLEKERPHFHALPADAFTPALGVSRRVPVNTPMVSFEGGQYSVPETWCGREVFVRAVGGGHTESIVIMTLKRPRRRHRNRSPPTSSPWPTPNQRRPFPHRCAAPGTRGVSDCAHQL